MLNVKFQHVQHLRHVHLTCTNLQMKLSLTFLCMCLNLDRFVSLILLFIFIICTFTYPFMYKHGSIAVMFLDQSCWTGVRGVIRHPLCSTRHHILRCTMSCKHLSTKGFSSYGKLELF